MRDNISMFIDNFPTIYLSSLYFVNLFRLGVDELF